MDDFSNSLTELPLRVQTGFSRTFGVLTVVWTLGDVVRKLRGDRRWTQAGLGERAGVHSTVIVRLERESAKSERGTIERVARALEVSVADLYAYAEEISLAAELSESERRSVMAYQRRLIAKRQPHAGTPPVPALQRDPPAIARESVEPIQKRRRR